VTIAVVQTALSLFSGFFFFSFACSLICCWSESFYDNNIGSFLNSIHAHVNLKYKEVLNTYEDMYSIAFLDDMIT
jgi:hypothetical protein